MKDSVAIVCHDAGGAEILSSWMNRSWHDCMVAVSGPALPIFKRKCPQANFLTIENAINKCNWVLCGTGWQTNFERSAIILGRSLGKKTVAFLDHWINYLERFQEQGSTLLPDEIWVGDRDAEEIAKALFQNTPILLHSNPYFEDLLEEIAGKNVNNFCNLGNNVLYVCEPIAEHALMQYGSEHYHGYTEHEALRFFLSNVSALGVPINSINIRPHPSEDRAKYYWARDMQPGKILFGGEKPLLEEVLEADIIIGCETMAMVVGLMAGKRVVCTIPLGGRPCQLPHQAIESMQKLIAGYGTHV